MLSSNKTTSVGFQLLLRSREHNEYGGVDGVKENLNTEFLLWSFKDKLATFSDRAKLLEITEKSCTTLEGLLKAISASELRYRHPEVEFRGKKTSSRIRNKLIEGFFIREEIYQSLVSMEFNHDYMKLHFSKNDFIESGKIFMTEAKNLADELLAKAKKQKIPRSMFGIMLQGQFESQKHIFHNYMRFAFAKQNHMEHTLYVDFLLDKFKAGMKPNEPKVVKLIEELAEFMMLDICLQRLRKTWQSQDTHGNQDDHLKSMVSWRRRF